AGVKVAAPAFYALNRARMPLFASLAAVATNVILNALLFPVMGFAGLAVGTSIGAIANFTVLIVAFRRAGGNLSGQHLWSHLAKTTLAAIVGAGIAMATAIGLETTLGTEGTLPRLVVVGLALAAGGSVYLAICRILGLPELTTFV